MKNKVKILFYIPDTSYYKTNNTLTKAVID